MEVYEYQTKQLWGKLPTAKVFIFIVFNYNVGKQMFGEILILMSVVFLILRYAKDENANAERAIYALLSALFLFVGWYFYIFPLASTISSSASAFTCNSIGCTTNQTTHTITNTTIYSQTSAYLHYN